MARYFVFKFFLYSLLLVINLGLAALLFYKHYNIAFVVMFTKCSWMLFVYLFFYAYHGLLTKRMITITETYLILKSNLFSFVVIYIFSILSAQLRCFTYTSAAIFFFNIFLPVAVYFAKNYFQQFPYLQEKIFIICDAKGFDNIKKWFSIKNGFGFRVKEMVYVDKLSNSEIKAKISECLDKKYDAAVVAIYSYPLFKISYYIDYIQKKVSKILIFPRISSLPLFNIEIINSVNYKGLAFMLRNNLLNPLAKATKRVFDLILSIVLLIALSPVLILTYLAILLFDGGSAVFKQERIGENGNSFNVYKFRTMIKNGDTLLAEFLEHNKEAQKEYIKFKKLKNDPRITKLGKLLRKFSIDELPQLVNVLKGEMSLVGPRPYLKSEIVEWGGYFEYYKMVKPGITGLWQVSGRNELTFNERIKLDVWYVKNWSLELDIIILIKTVVSVLSGRGSY